MTVATPAASERFAAQLEEILEHSAAIIARKGFHATSIRDIAAAVGKSVSTLYHYFKTKEDVLYLIQSNTFRCVMDNLRRATEGVEDPNVRLFLFIRNHIHYFTRHRNEMKVASHEGSTLPPERRKAITALKVEYFQMGRQIVREVLSSSGRDTAAGDETELDRITYCLFGMMNWIYNWYDPRLHGSQEELTRTIYRIFLCGAGAHCPFDEKIARCTKTWFEEAQKSIWNHQPGPEPARKGGRS
jgi:AcrR family transcriptional regulator